MLCDNCKKNEANIKYSENINGQKREMNLCEECSRKLGIMNKINFNMTTDFPSFFGSLLEDFEELESMPLLKEVKQSVCDSCNTSFEDIINTGRLGCPNCYDVFSERLDPILKRIQGANRHTGRLANELNNNVKYKDLSDKSNKETSLDKKAEENEQNVNNVELLNKLQEQLKDAIKDERYEDAAKLRDEIKNINENNKKTK